jgi:hypothetical protein
MMENLRRRLPPCHLPIFIGVSTRFAHEDAFKGLIMEIFLAAWLTMGIGAGLIAKAKGYGFTLWFIYGFFLGAIALLHSIFIRARLQTEHGF